MGKRAAVKAPSTRYVKGRAVSEVAEWVCVKLDEHEAAASEQGTTLAQFMQDTSHNKYVSSEFEHCYCCTHVCAYVVCVLSTTYNRIQHQHQRAHTPCTNAFKLPTI